MASPRYPTARDRTHELCSPLVSRLQNTMFAPLLCAFLHVRVLSCTDPKLMCFFWLFREGHMQVDAVLGGKERAPRCPCSQHAACRELQQTDNPRRIVAPVLSAEDNEVINFTRGRDLRHLTPSVKSSCGALASVVTRDKQEEQEVTMSECTFLPSVPNDRTDLQNT